jgi:two-component system phosphate regulon sensor histidine kinase PhoR
VSLAQRLLLGSLALLLAFILIIVALSGEQMARPLERLAVDRLARDARLVALDWSVADDADALADTAGRLLGLRVTLIAPDGRVVGDSEQPREQLGALENHLSREEVRAAIDSGVGWDRRASTSVGRDQLYVAVRGPLGVTRVSVDPADVDDIVRRAQWSILTAGSVALAVAALLALVFSRSITRPLIELRDVAQALAAGDLTRRPALAASGEVGDLAAALHRMSEQLDSRLRALEREDVLLTATIESLAEGVVVVNAARQVVRANDSARKLIALEDALPFPAERLPRERALRDALAEALDGGTVDEMELSLFGRTLLVRAKPLRHHGAVLTLRDVTAARRLEATRRDFVANVSHELKTPLTIIGGFAETLRDADIETEQRQHFAETIHASAQRMQRLVDDLLDLSRIESGGWKPNPTHLDVNAVVTDLLLPYRHAAQEKRIQLDTAIAPGAETVFADATALRQILGNLVDNSIRYTTDGRITVFAEPERDGLWIGVRDTGIGIAPEHLPRIFERFYRADAARSRAAGGTGLGLAIVKHLAEAHGGRVRADSSVGRGTTIATFFPSG